MAKLNGYDVVDRHNRPSVLSRVSLRTFFMNDGSYVDPVDISGVTIYSKWSNRDPSSIIGTAAQGGIASGLSPLMSWGNSSIDTANSAFDTSNYTPGTTASGIFRNKTGEYSVILDGQVSLSGVYEGSAIANTASATGDFIDAWQVRLKAGNPLQLLLGSFSLFNDTFLSVTEPVLLNSRARLQTKNIELGSTVQIRVPVDITIANEGISNELKNIFDEGIVTSASMEIVKENHATHLPARVEVSGFSDTSALIDISPDNILILLWDTDDLLTHAETIAGNLGSTAGDYFVRVKYTILDQEFISPRLPLQVR